MTSKSQEEAIFNYMQTGRSISAYEALEKFGCFRLAARIFSLRGTIKIESTRVKTPHGRWIVKYRLAH